MNPRVIGQPLEEIRRMFVMPGLPAEAVGTAVHEAAHATIAMALGTEVTGVYIRAAERSSGICWHGECTYLNAVLSDEDERFIAVAGLAGSSFLHSSITATDSPFRGLTGDFETLKGLNVNHANRREYAEVVQRVLCDSLDTFDHIAAALIVKLGSGSMGYLDQTDMQEIAAMLPVKQVDTSRHLKQHRTMQAETPGGVRV